jgi:hypothetical protein
MRGGVKAFWDGLDEKRKERAAQGARLGMTTAVTLPTAIDTPVLRGMDHVEFDVGNAQQAA